MMRLKGTLAAASVAAMMVFNIPAQAGGVPTFDGVAVGQLLQQFLETQKNTQINDKSLGELINQLKVMRDHYQNAQDTLASITGARDAIAALFEGDIGEAQIAITLEKLRNITGVSDGVKKRFGEIDKLFEFVDGDTMFGDKDDSAREAVYNLEQASVKTEIVVSEAIFEDAGTAFEHYDTYRKQLGSGNNDDLKAAIDLNTRVQIENGENLAKLMQMMAVQSQSNAIMNAAALRRHSRNSQMLRMSEANRKDDE